MEDSYIESSCGTLAPYSCSVYDIHSIPLFVPSRHGTLSMNAGICKQKRAKEVLTSITLCDASRPCTASCSRQFQRENGIVFTVVPK